MQHQNLYRHGTRKKETITALGVIVPPKDQWIYRNVVFASSTGPTRVAVIWQANCRGHEHSELYFYDIPNILLFRTREEGTAEQRDAYLQRLTGPDLTVLSEHLESAGWFINIYGSRVQSLSWQMGGIHPSSPLWDASFERSSRHPFDVQEALGGLQITQSTTGRRGEFVEIRKCFVWGPAESDEQHVSLIIFDFRFEGSTILLRNVCPDEHPVWQSNPINPPEYHFTHCACALHDDGYDIVLPDTSCDALIARTAQSQKTQSQCTSSAKTSTGEPSYPKHGTEEYWRKEELLHKKLRTLFPKSGPSFPSLFCTKSPPPTPALGSITHYDPPARKEALERRDEELREHIRRWKREGKSDFDIAQGWSHSRWSGWGTIAKPEGWQNL